jgi:hypothetical protein
MSRVSSTPRWTSRRPTARPGSAIGAWRGGYLTGLDDRNTNLHPEPTGKETAHG